MWKSSMIDDYEDNDRDEVKEQFKLNAAQDEVYMPWICMNIQVVGNESLY